MVVPTSHQDLLDRASDAVLTTEMPDGRLQSTVVWFSRGSEPGEVLVNTMQEFQKARNLRRRPRATVLIGEPGWERWLELRCDVTMSTDGAGSHLDDLARAYAGAAPYFGAVVPAEFADVEHPVLCRLHAVAATTGPGRTPAGSRSVVAAPDEASGCRDEPAFPADHLDLVDRPTLAAFSTRIGDRAQTHPTWFERDGNDLLINTTLERQKGRNLLADRRATVLVIDPEDSGRWIEVRGDVDLQTSGALEQLDRLTRRYTSHQAFYGGVYPAERRDLETRIIARVHPRRINVDAVH
jgi:PPOX class probable F420-dependent enzyme